ncbi:MAG: hypothetical protein JRI22_19545 [Deltaproteobacteria bacterium]|nr:hypothetical protein [Deltaproteobacteria bacterium]
MPKPKIKSIIKLISHPHPFETAQARYDEAIVTRQPVMENPWWYENTETNQLYHGLYGCIGWPSEVNSDGNFLPGYIAVIGVVRPNDTMEHYNPINANFQLLDEFEHDDVPSLLTEVLRIRDKWGFGVQPELFTSWYGDPERFLTTLALRNEFLVKMGGERMAISITPPIDFYTPKIFDNYVRSLRSTVVPGQTPRLYFGGCNIIKARMKEFKRDDPAVLAVGGMVHSMLSRVMWMSQVRSNVFSVEENA